jgi:hypothetical protein
MALPSEYEQVSLTHSSADLMIVFQLQLHLDDAGLTFEKAARELQRRKLRTAKGGRWHISAVQIVVRLTWRNFVGCSKAAAAASRRVLLADRKRGLANVTRIIVKYRKKGRSCASIAEELNRKGLKTQEVVRSPVLQSTFWTPALFEAA